MIDQKHNIYTAAFDHTSSFDPATIAAAVTATKSIIAFVKNNKDRKKSPWDKSPNDQKTAMVMAAIHHEIGTNVVPQLVKSGKAGSESESMKRAFDLMKSKGVFVNGKGEDTKPDSNRFWNTTDVWAGNRLKLAYKKAIEAFKSGQLGHSGSGTDWLVSEGWITEPQKITGSSTARKAAPGTDSSTSENIAKKTTSFFSRNKKAIIITVVVILVISASVFAYMKIKK